MELLVIRSTYNNLITDNIIQQYKDKILFTIANSNSWAIFAKGNYWIEIGHFFIKYYANLNIKLLETGCIEDKNFFNYIKKPYFNYILLPIL